MTSAETAHTLTDSLHLHQPPVAIAFTDAIPSGVRSYAGLVPAECRFWQEATQGTFATIPRDHELCAIGVYTHHLDSSKGVQADLVGALKVFGDLGYVRPEDMAFIPVLERGVYEVYEGLRGGRAAHPCEVIFKSQ